MKILRASAIVDLANRFEKVIDKITEWRIVEKDAGEKNHQFSWKGRIEKLSMLDYGCLCEVGYIVYKFEVTEQEIRDAFKLK